jgi:hypothetical protein
MSTEKLKAGGVFTVTCYDKDGNLKWADSTPNLVVNAGLKLMNDQFFTGSDYTAAWYLGLYGAAGSNIPAAGDTMASHAGWTEVTQYDEVSRRPANFGASTTADPAVISNALSIATFTINSSVTIGGAFLTTDATKGGAVGTLFSAGAFAAPGDRAVVSGDVINLTYQFSLDAA